MFLVDICKLNKTPGDATCWENHQEVFVMLIVFYPHWSFLRFRATFPCHWHFTLVSQAREGLYQL